MHKGARTSRVIAGILAVLGVVALGRRRARNAVVSAPAPPVRDPGAMRSTPISVSVTENAAKIGVEAAVSHGATPVAREDVSGISARSDMWRYLAPPLLAVVATATAIIEPACRPEVVAAGAFVIPGAALVWRPRGDPRLSVPARLALIIVVSLSVEVAIAVGMAWTGLWYPKPAAWCAAGACVLVFLVRTLHGFRTDPPIPEPDEDPDPVSETRLIASGTFAATAPAVAAVTLLVAGMIAWALSLHSIDITRLGTFGLPPVLPVQWYAALGVLVAGAVVTIWRMQFRPWLAAAYVGAVAIVLFVTVPVLFDMPQFAWAYKHIGVTEYIASHGATLPSHDIYQRWPGFFSLAAWLSSITRTDVLALARWNSPFFSLLDILLVAGLASVVTRDRRVWAMAALVFCVINWLGASYFSPQALAYAVAIVLLTLALSHVTTHARGVGSLRPRDLWRTLGWGTGDAKPGVFEPQPTFLLLMVGLDAVVVVTHQLTPYVLMLQLAALGICNAVRTRWVVLASAILPAAYLVPNLSFVERLYGPLFNGLNLFENAEVTPGAAEHRDFVAQHAGALLTLLVGVATALCVVRLARRWDLRMTIACALTAVAPAAILFGENYGGEATLRVFLFAVPWLAILIALGVATLRPRSRVIVSLAGTLVATWIFLYASYDTAATSLFPRSEVVASRYFYARAPQRSMLMLSGPSFPSWIGARYVDMVGVIGDSIPNLFALSRFQHRAPGPGDVSWIAAYLRRSAPHPFIVFSTSQELYARDFGPGSRRQMNVLERAVAQSSRYQLWYRNADTRIYRVIR